MKLRFAERADKDYAVLPAAVRKAFAKQLSVIYEVPKPAPRLGLAELSVTGGGAELRTGTARLAILEWYASNRRQQG